MFRLIAVALGLVAFAIPFSVSAAQVNIGMTSNAFLPKTTTINLGDTVLWTNTDTMNHTVTFDSGTNNSPVIAPGQSFSHTFSTLGTFPYHCIYHGATGGVGMAGSIVVNNPVASNTSTFGNTTSVSVSATTNTSNTTNISTGNAQQLSAQAAALLAQVQALQAQLLAGGSSIVGSTEGTVPISGNSGVNSSACPNIGRVLKKGMTGDDVSRLQQFLLRDPSVYPEALVTGYYGELTELAVKRWQTKYNIVSSGSPETTGYGQVGPRTAAAIALLCSTGGYGGNTSTSPVGGFIQVSPISGNAPLAVNVVATVNTTNSCQGAIYTLNWGDNTNPVQIPVSANNCTQVAQTYQHTYTYGGTFQITLSAGAHQTSATVAVYGPTGPTQTTPTTTPGLPAESISASPTSGAAPLPVSFTGIVTSANAGWCASGCSATLEYGDGSETNIPLPTPAGSWSNFAVQRTYQNPGTYVAKLHQGNKSAGRTPVGIVTITATGTSTTPSASTTPAYSYQAITLTPAVSGNPYAVTLGFDLPSSCTGYDISWGDNTSRDIQNHGTSCTQSTITKNVSHTYPSLGNFTITVKRGATLNRIDTAGITISQ